MFGTLGTTLCFALTPVLANRAAARLGSLPANFWRLLVALLVLGLWTFWAGRRPGPDAAAWFLIGGVAGFGVGGVAMFQSLPRLGSNLSTLIVQCVTVPVAAVTEYFWLGTALTPLQMLGAALTVTGIVVGLLPRSLTRVSPAQFSAGVSWALLSAVGQGAGAVFSRKAFAVALAAHQPVDPGTAACYRVVGGLVVAGLVLLWPRPASGANPIPAGRAWPWVVGNALTGPVLGVTCYQWALRTTAAGLVQPIVATAPLLTIPLAVWIEHAPRPRASYYAGTLLAIIGATTIALAR